MKEKKGMGKEGKTNALNSFIFDFKMFFTSPGKITAR